MDTTLAGSVLGSLTSWKADALAQFTSIVPVALGLVVSIAVVYFMIRTFRSIVHI